MKIVITLIVCLFSRALFKHHMHNPSLAWFIAYVTGIAAIAICTFNNRKDKDNE